MSSVYAGLFQAELRALSGRALVGSRAPSVEVRLAGTTTLATLYNQAGTLVALAALGEAASLANPLDDASMLGEVGIDAAGNYTFFADADLEYDISYESASSSQAIAPLRVKRLSVDPREPPRTGAVTEAMLAFTVGTQVDVDAEAAARTSADVVLAGAVMDEAAARAAADSALIPLAQRAAANGVATLGADLKIPTTQIPGAAPQTLALLGDSIIAGGWAMAGPAPLGPGTTFSSVSVSIGAVTWAQMRLRDRFTVVGCRATGGYGLRTWLTTNLAELTALLATRPRWLLAHIGTNDLGLLARTAAQLIADFQTLIALAAAQGIGVVLTTILPRGAPNALSAPQEADRVTVNQWLKAAPLAYRGVLCVDWATPMTTGFAGAPIAAYFQDALHPNTAGGELMGQMLADVLSPLSAPAENLTETNTDPTNILVNGLMAGNASGLATPGWSATNGSPVPTFTKSKVARTDGPGEWQKFDITVTGEVKLEQIVAATTLVPGDRYIAECAFRNAAFSSLVEFKLYCLLLTPGFAGQCNVPLAGPLTAANFPASGVLRTVPVYATVAAATVYCQFYVSGVGSVEVSQFRVRSVGP